jgi:hypothetical protein
MQTRFQHFHPMDERFASQIRLRTRHFDEGEFERKARLAVASPTRLEGDTLTLSFRPGAEFHRMQAEEPNNVQLLREALYDVTGRRLAVVTAVAESASSHVGGDDDEEEDTPLDERGFIALLESDLDATEVEDRP